MDLNSPEVNSSCMWLVDTPKQIWLFLNENNAKGKGTKKSNGLRQTIRTDRRYGDHFRMSRGHTYTLQIHELVKSEHTFHGI